MDAIGSITAITAGVMRRIADSIDGKHSRPAKAGSALPLHLARTRSSRQPGQARRQGQGLVQALTTRTGGPTRTEVRHAN